MEPIRGLKPAPILLSEGFGRLQDALLPVRLQFRFSRLRPGSGILSAALLGAVVPTQVSQVNKTK
jgi:hypothetical protein